jgi:hypothetical protein
VIERTFQTGAFANDFLKALLGTQFFAEKEEIKD